MGVLTWELMGIVVGAGLASGREIAAFFAQYGRWGYAGILLAAGVMAFLADARMPALRHRWQEQLWQGVMMLLLMAVGGAMLAAAGEIASLTLPIHGAGWLGMAATLALSWWLAYRTLTGLKWVSGMLLLVMAVTVCIGLVLPPVKAVTVVTLSVPKALLSGCAYGGFNAALQSSLLAGTDADRPLRRRALLRACAGLMVLLGLGNAVLLRHPALLGEPMPFVQLLGRLGKPGYWLGAACLYLAVLSTLTACLRSLERNRWRILGICAASLAGFGGVVEGVYPLIGMACLLALLGAKCANCRRNPFHSRGNMI